MIGQKKRPLEPSVTRLPVKCYREDLSRYDEAIKRGLKQDAENLKTSSFLESQALAEANQQLLLDTSSCNGEAKSPLLAKQLPSSFIYHEGPTANKQPELSKISFTPERTVCLGSSSSLVHPIHLWLPSPSRHILEQSHETGEPCTTVVLEPYQKLFHHHFSNECVLHRKKVPIGADFQANVPVWEDRAVESPEDGKSEDKKNERGWLGLQVWPLPGCKQTKDESEIGKGRNGICSCLHRGSVECIQMHVHEKTMKLKMELGKAFELLGFDEMGECVSDQWMEEDEYRFKMLVKLNPVSLGRNFWHVLPYAFPTKRLSDLVSYYFNVFVLRLRAIQNRLDPENIDSDDNECNSSNSDSDDSDGYETDEGGNMKQDESDEGKSENDWDEPTDNQPKQALDTSSFLNGELPSGGRWSSVCENQDIGHHYTSNHFAGLLPPTKDTSESLSNPSRESMPDSPLMALPEWNLDLKLGCKHLLVSNQSKGADNLPGDKNDNLHLDNQYFMQINHTPDRDSHLKLRSPYEFELSPYMKESEFCKDHPSFMQRSSLETCNPDLRVGYMDLLPRKSIDKLISTAGLIAELFGDGARENDIEKKVSGHRLSTFRSNGWRGER